MVNTIYMQHQEGNVLAGSTCIQPAKIRHLLHNTCIKHLRKNKSSFQRLQMFKLKKHQDNISV